MERFVGAEPGALSLCLALARAGHAVTLIDGDAADRSRLSDMLPRLLGPRADLFALQAEPQDAAQPLFSGGGSAPISTVWGGMRPVLHHAEGAVSGHVIEQIGPDEGGHIARIAQALDALHLVLPAGAMPLSARFHAALGRALENALLTSGTPEALDAALVAAGFALGPFVLQDRLGIDTLLSQRHAVERAFGLPPLPLFARAVSEGRLGRKASVGWYRYPGQGGAVEDPLVEDMAEEEAHFAGWRRAQVEEAESAGQITQQMDALAWDLVRSGIAPAATVLGVAECVIGYRPRRPAIRPNTTAANSPLPDK